jgi:DNA/RNA-binding domain of Phe-tRNA-synthetase-like protein
MEGSGALSWRVRRDRRASARSGSGEAQAARDAAPGDDEPPGGRFEPECGWVAPAVRDELPQLRVLFAGVEVRTDASLTGRSPREIETRLRVLSNGFRGARAVAVRREPVPVAYRTFYRQIGLDPDVVRPPLEEVVLERMLHGGFVSEGLLADVLLIALLDTGVRTWALDAQPVRGTLGIRASRDGESLGRFAEAPALPAGRLVVADESVALATLFGELAPGHAPVASTSSLLLFAIQVPGVPTLYVEEALWTCRAALS